MTMMTMESNPNGHWLWDQMGSCPTWNGVYSIGKNGPWEFCWTATTDCVSWSAAASGHGHIYRSPEGCRLYNATRWLAPCSSAPFMDADICLETRVRELDSRAGGGEGDVHALVCSSYEMKARECII